MEENRVGGSSGGYECTAQWFELFARKVWDHLLPQLGPARILEIGSYEGASTCYLIELFGNRHPLEIHCIDNWAGGIENQPGARSEADMGEVEQRFLRNTQRAVARARHKVDLVCHKGNSDLELARMLVGGKRNYFDFVYVDGSHQAPDVLCDAVLAFRLLRLQGLMAFDDYVWAEDLPTGLDPLRCPKPAVDAFTNIYFRQARVLSAPLYQLYVQKVA